jgi:hypothetical protein
LTASFSIRPEIRGGIGIRGGGGSGGGSNRSGSSVLFTKKLLNGTKVKLSPTEIIAYDFILIQTPKV